MSTATAPQVAVCDYGVGNMRSVERALQRAGAEVTVSADPGALESADGVVLPGVGAFATAATALRSGGLAEAVLRVASSGRPLLGVCLGYQLLFSDSEEGDGGDGLALVPGHVRRLPDTVARVPHVGWNTLMFAGAQPMFAGLDDGTHVYFTHSYVAEPDDPADVAATSRHAQPIVAAVRRNNVMGTQFHPEKSGPAGLRIYVNFVGECATVRA